MRRRSLLLGLLAACGRKQGDEAPTPPSSLLPPTMTLLDWAFGGDEARGGATRATVLVPRGAGPFPVLVALHGRGEAVRGAEAGAYGWPRDYKIGNALGALARGRLTAADLLRQVSPARLDTLNQALAAHPYAGLIVVCPHAPDLTGARNDGAIQAYGDWVTARLLPRLKGAAPAGEAVGIDGVSMGGRMALKIGLARPEVFTAVGSLQAAIKADEAPELARAAQAFLQKRPAGRLRLLSSDGDYFRGAIEAAHREFERVGVPHEHLEVVGPHNYEFNQGPGSIEMLWWHDRALRPS